MFEYDIKEGRQAGDYYDRGRAFEVTAQVQPVTDGGYFHKPVGIALLDVLNNSGFEAGVHNAGLGNRVYVRFVKPQDEKATHLLAIFHLPQPDHEEIQHIADQAQRFLSHTMTTAIRVFEMVQAVGSVNPYKAQLERVS